jgi:hypothetical protein
MIEIGSPTAEMLFRARHAGFFEGSAALERALSLAFDRAFKATDSIGTVIFFLGSRCADDFREVLLLAANGQGWGARAHVRGMFERCVTAAYLHENPQYVQDFIDYDFVRRAKTAKALEAIIDFSSEQKADNEKLQQRAEAVEKRFMVPICKTCRTERVNHTWSRLDVVAMARNIKKMETIRDMLAGAYYLPLDQAHSTLGSIIKRIGDVGGDFFAVDETLNREEADRTFELAHLLALNALVVQYEHFQLPELVRPIAEAFEHFKKVWPTS